MSRLRDALDAGTFVVTAELGPPVEPDPAPVRETARRFAPIVHAANSLIAPSKEVQVYNDTSAATAALKNKQIDGLVVDLPTALFLTAAELDNAKVVGQFSAPGGDDWGIVLPKDSALKTCLNEALAALKSSGQLDAITKQWMTDSAGAPELQ